jgi:hypothetical protein
MTYIILLIVGVGGGWFSQKLLGGRRARSRSYGYEADIYQWLFENGIKADTQAVADLFVILAQYLKKDKQKKDDNQPIL